MSIPGDKALPYKPSLVQGYSNYRKNDSITDSISEAQRVLKNVAASLEISGKDVSGVDATFKEIMNLSVDREAYSDAVKNMAENHPEYIQVNTNDYESSLVDRPNAVVDKKFQTLKEEYRNLPESQRFSRYNHIERVYKSFRENIFRQTHGVDEEFPDMQRFYADCDDELMVEEAVISYTCPLTKEYYDDPVTSRVCGHTFSRAAIEDVFRNSNWGVIKCPIPACSHHFRYNDLQPNVEIAAKAKARKERDAKETQRRNQTFERL